MIATLGIEFTEIGEDFLVARMPVDERTFQPYGIMHGGASCVLAETVGSTAGLLCLDTTQYYVLGLSMNTNHLKVARSGFVIGTARPKHLGRTTQLWDITITNEQGKVVSENRLTNMVRERKSDQLELPLPK